MDNRRDDGDGRAEEDVGTQRDGDRSPSLPSTSTWSAVPDPSAGSSSGSHAATSSSDGTHRIDEGDGVENDANGGDANHRGPTPRNHREGQKLRLSASELLESLGVADGTMMESSLPSSSTWSAVPPPSRPRPRPRLSASRGEIGSGSGGVEDGNGSVPTGEEGDGRKSRRGPKKSFTSSASEIPEKEGGMMEASLPSTSTFSAIVAMSGDVSSPCRSGSNAAISSKPPGVASVPPRRPQPRRPRSPPLPSTSTWSAVPTSVRLTGSTGVGSQDGGVAEGGEEDGGSGRTDTGGDWNKSHHRTLKLRMSATELLEMEGRMEVSLPSTSTFSAFKKAGVVSGDKPERKGGKEVQEGGKTSHTTAGKSKGGGRLSTAVRGGPPTVLGIRQQQPETPATASPRLPAAEEMVVTVTTGVTTSGDGNGGGGGSSSHSGPPSREEPPSVTTSGDPDEGVEMVEPEGIATSSSPAPPIASAAPTDAGVTTSCGEDIEKVSDDGSSEKKPRVDDDPSEKSTPATTTTTDVDVDVDVRRMGSAEDDNSSSSTRRRSTTIASKPPGTAAPAPRRRPPPPSPSSSWSTGRTEVDKSRPGGPKRCVSASELLGRERERDVVESSSRLPSSLSRSTAVVKTGAIAGERPEGKGWNGAEQDGCHSSDDLTALDRNAGGGKLCLTARELLKKEPVQRPNSRGSTFPSLHAAATTTTTSTSIATRNGKSDETPHSRPPSRDRLLDVATNEMSEEAVPIPAPSSTPSVAASGPTNLGSAEEGFSQPQTDLLCPSLPSSSSTTSVTQSPSSTAGTWLNDSMEASGQVNERVDTVAPETKSCRPSSSSSSTTNVALVPSTSLKDCVSVEDGASVHADTSTKRQRKEKLYMPASELLEQELGMDRTSKASNGTNGRGISASSPSLLGLRHGRSASFRERTLSSPCPRPPSSSSKSLGISSSVAPRPSSTAGRVESIRRSHSVEPYVTAEIVNSGAGKGSMTTNDTSMKMETSNKKPPTGSTAVTKGKTVGAASASQLHQQRASAAPTRASDTGKKVPSEVDSLDVLCVRSTEKYSEETGGRVASLSSVQQPSTSSLGATPASIVLRRSSTPRVRSAPDSSLPVSSSKPVHGRRSTGKIVLLGARNTGNVLPAAKKDNNGVTKQKDVGDRDSTLPTSKQSSLPQKENESNSSNSLPPSVATERKNTSTKRPKDSSLGSTSPSGIVSKQKSRRHIGVSGQSKSETTSSQMPGSHPNDRDAKQRRGSGIGTNPPPLAVQRERSQRRINSERDDQQKATETRRNLDKRTARLRYADAFKADIASHKANSPRFVINAADGMSTSERLSDLRNRCKTRSGVMVFVRKRPIFKYELDRGDFDVVSIVDGSTNTSTTVHETTRDEVVMHCCSMHPDMRQMYVKDVSFPCAAAFDEHCSNDDVFDCIAEPLVRAAAAGGVSTILMQGQTGSGKSYTMTGLEERACGCLFNAAAEWSHAAEGMSGNSHDPASFMPTVTVTFIELAGKKCKDLLGSSSKEAATTRIVDGEDGSVRILNAQHKVVNCAEDLLRVIRNGKSRRATEATDKNGVSSRSHAVCQIVLSYEGMDCGQRGVLTLIDCAGSERRHDSLHHSIDRQRESAEINASLWSLKECIRARAHNDVQPLIEKAAVHVPYRSSNLTRILRESFERKDASLCIIGTVSPNATDTEHSMETLKMLSTIVGQEDLLKEGESRLVVVKKKKRSIAPRDWDNKQLMSWLQKNGFQDMKNPHDMDGRIMKMTAMQLSMQFGGDKAKAEFLFNLLRLESDRIAKKQLKERIETKNMRRSTTSS